MAVFDHQDILDLLAEGDIDAARELYDRRLSGPKVGVSGHDQHTLNAAFEEAEAAVEAKAAAKSSKK